MPDSLVFVASAAGILGLSVGRVRRAHREACKEGIQESVQRSSTPLRLTIRAVHQCARNALNIEWVETTIVFPAASGAARGGHAAWFVRELGSKRIKVWATEAARARGPVVTYIEVTEVHVQGDPDWPMRRLRGRDQQSDRPSDS